MSQLAMTGDQYQAAGRRSGWRRAGREMRSIALLVLGVLAARSAIADHYHVPSGSMEPTLIAGDRVEIRGGRLLINEEPAAVDGKWEIERIGDQIVRLNLAHGGGPDYRESVPPGKLLAVGDHRGNSLDGRFFGLIDETAVYGRAEAVYYRNGEGLVW